MTSFTVPLIIGGKEFVPHEKQPIPLFKPNPHNAKNDGISAVGATPNLCVQAVDSCAEAFIGWKDSHPTERRRLFNNLAQLLRDRAEEIQISIQNEISCTEKWAKINVNDSIALVEECAAIVTTGVLSGVIPTVRDTEACAMVLREPLGVILAIAPWNAPLILGVRAVAAAVAAGNTAILKGSEISPRTHFLVAKLFQDAGFPAGVVNYIQHDPKDASACFETMISQSAVQKCNFTGSTAVGRHVAQRAGFYLKPVTLELGGKNFAIVTADADLEKAADEVLLGAFLNSGQICMATDIVLVARSVEQEFRKVIRANMPKASQDVLTVINEKSQIRIRELVYDAKRKGAKISPDEEGYLDSAFILEDVTEEMDFWRTESFAPLIGLVVYEAEEQAVKIVNDSLYGLSGAIFSRNHMNALSLAKKIHTGAIHINSATVHDEPTLPHGGRKDSGWGRFGGHWGLEEFLQTKTIILHP